MCENYPYYSVFIMGALPPPSQKATNDNIALSSQNETSETNSIYGGVYIYKKRSYEQHLCGVFFWGEGFMDFIMSKSGLHFYAVKL